jgi:hypothetical protein
MKYILGYGIAGAICSHYFPDYTVVASNFDGESMRKNSLSLGPRYVYYSDKAKRLFEELNLSTGLLEIRVNYLCNGVQSDALTDEMLCLYNLKTRKTLGNVSGSMSSGMSNLKVFECTQAELFDALRVHNKGLKITSNVTNISLSRKTLRMHSFVYPHSAKFEKVICTLPLPVLQKMGSLSDAKNYKCLSQSIFFKELKLKEDFEAYKIEKKMFDTCDILYIVDNGIDVYRVSKIVVAGSDVFVAESMKKQDKWIEVPYSKICNPSHFDSLSKEFLLVGRYAQWDNKVRTREVIERAQDLAEAK